LEVRAYNTSYQSSTQPALNIDRQKQFKKVLPTEIIHNTPIKRKKWP